MIRQHETMNSDYVVNITIEIPKCFAPEWEDDNSYENIRYLVLAIFIPLQLMCKVI